MNPCNPERGVVQYPYQPRTSGGMRQVNFLCNGQFEEGWGFPWIMRNSEVVNEAG